MKPSMELGEDEEATSFSICLGLRTPSLLDPVPMATAHPAKGGFAQWLRV